MTLRLSDIVTILNDDQVSGVDFLCHDILIVVDEYDVSAAERDLVAVLSVDDEVGSTTSFFRGAPSSSGAAVFWGLTLPGLGSRIPIKTGGGVSFVSPLKKCLKHWKIQKIRPLLL